jgi:tellurite resistance protein TerC
MNPNEFLFFAAFLIFIGGMLVLDLGVFSRKVHVVSFKEASIWSIAWVSLALVFSLVIKFYGDRIHGIENFETLETKVKLYVDDKDELAYFNAADFERSLQSYRDNMAMEFITGWLLEYSLSVDNIFVIILIFSSFRVREKYFKKVLLWGILGAIVMRFVFIFVGSALIHRFHWILYLFGGLLIYSGLKMFFDKGDEHLETDKHPVVKFASRYFRVFPRYLGDKFFVRKVGKLYITPLFVVVLIVEFTDLLFAVDSVPAVFAVTQDPYIVFFSNIFAIMGLRSMFFFLSNVMHLFHYLKMGLSFLLIFIGVKMIAYEHLMKPIGFKTQYSLYVILAILTTSVVASLLFPKQKEVTFNEKEKEKEKESEVLKV